MINPIERLPLAIKAIRDFIVDFVVKHFALLIIFLIAGIALLWFASTRDFIIYCQPYDTNSGISCPLK